MKKEQEKKNCREIFLETNQHRESLGPKNKQTKFLELFSANSLTCQMNQWFYNHKKIIKEIFTLVNLLFSSS